MKKFTLIEIEELYEEGKIDKIRYLTMKSKVDMTNRIAKKNDEIRKRNIEINKENMEKVKEFNKIFEKSGILNMMERKILNDCKKQKEYSNSLDKSMF